MTSLITFGAFTVHPQRRDHFIEGKLSQEWYDQYPAIFDRDDLRLAKTQPRNHFYEWLAAITIFHSTGYLSLIEKYQFTKDGHKRKQEVVEQIGSPTLKAALLHRGDYGSVQCPDLLVYAPDLSDWFFCEVKGGKDKLRAKQELHFQALQYLTGKSVWLVEFHVVGKNAFKPRVSFR